jgi:hypothetical protein
VAQPELILFHSYSAGSLPTRCAAVSWCLGIYVVVSAFVVVIFVVAVITLK